MIVKEQNTGWFVEQADALSHNVLILWFYSSVNIPA